MKHFLLPLISGLLLAGCGPGEDEKRTQITQLIEASHVDMQAGRGDSADFKLTRALRISPEKGDLLNAELNALSFDVVRARSDDFRDKSLGRLSAKAVVALKKGDNITYLDDADANGFLLKRMRARTPEWAELRRHVLLDQTSQRKTDAETRQRDEAMGANLRRTYATVLRDNFLDNNLDINVTVSGKNATYLKLRYALFGAVWGRKFQTEGLFAKFQSMGFKKVELTDNYDYDYIWTL